MVVLPVSTSIFASSLATKMALASSHSKLLAALQISRFFVCVERAVSVCLVSTGTRELTQSGAEHRPESHVA